MKNKCVNTAKAHRKTKLFVGLAGLFLFGATTAAIFLVPTREKRLAAETHNGGEGRIKVSSFEIIPPIELFPEQQTIAAPNPWFFPGFERYDLQLFLTAAPLPPALCQDLINRIEEFPNLDGCAILPSAEEVLALPPEGRARIYNYLSRFEVNHEQACARRFPGKSAREWMENAAISEKTLKQVEALMYQNGSLLFFADIHVLMNSIEDSKERLEVYKALNRVKTLRLSVSIPNHDALASMMEYWGAINQQSSVEPVLQGLWKSGKSIDMIYLLPPFARTHLYRFPDTNDENKKIKDCQWSAFNFFNWPIDDELGQSVQLQDVIVKDYAVIQEDQLQYGDIVLYLYEGGGKSELVHSAVFIDKDIVFTKNGTVWSSPWMFMYMKHMDDYYPVGKPQRKMYLRRKVSSL